MDLISDRGNFKRVIFQPVRRVGHGVNTEKKQTVHTITQCTFGYQQKDGKEQALRECKSETLEVGELDIAVASTVTYPPVEHTTEFNHQLRHNDELKDPVQRDNIRLLTS